MKSLAIHRFTLLPFKKSVRCSSLFAACAMNTDVLGTCVAQAEIGPTLYSTPYYNRAGLGLMRVIGFVGMQTSSIFRFGAFLADRRCLGRGILSPSGYLI